MLKTGVAAAEIGMTTGIDTAPAGRAIRTDMGTFACAPAIITAITTLTSGMVVTTAITIAQVTSKLPGAIRSSDGTPLPAVRQVPLSRAAG